VNGPFGFEAGARALLAELRAALETEAGAGVSVMRVVAE